MKKSFIFLLFVSVVALAAMNIYQNNHKLALSDITLANVEALANETGGGEGDDGGWGPAVQKDCWTVFLGYDGSYYATCSNWTQDPSVMFPCGAITPQKPTLFALKGICYQFI